MDTPEHDAAEQCAQWVRSMARGMHDLAQPITSAMGNLEIALLQKQTAEELRQAIEFSRAEMERAIQIMEFVRQLIRLQTPAEDVASFSLSGLLAKLIEDMRFTFDTAGVKLMLSAGCNEPGMRASLGRLRQMLFCILQGAGAAARAGDTLTLTVSGTSGEVLLDVALLGRHSEAEAGDASEPAALRQAPHAFVLAEAIARNAEGTWTVSDVPFRLQVRLPASSHALGEVGRLASIADG